jgi:DNA-binding transcriptional LysR family regulator
VALTAAGEDLQLRARALLAARDEAKAAVRRVAAGEQGALRIGFGASAAIGILPEAVRAYRARFPSVRLEVIEYDSNTEAELLAHRFDLAIFRGPLRSDRLIVETLASEMLLLVVSAEHPGAGTLTLADVAGEPFVLFPRHSSPVLHDSIIGACRRAGFSPDIVQQATSWSAVSSLVAAGIGVTVAPASARLLQIPGLVFHEIAGTEGGAELNGAWLEGALQPAARNFLDAVRETLKRLGLAR